MTLTGRQSWGFKGWKLSNCGLAEYVTLVKCLYRKVVFVACDVTIGQPDHILIQLVASHWLMMTSYTYLCDGVIEAALSYPPELVQ